MSSPLRRAVDPVDRPAAAKSSVGRTRRRSRTAAALVSTALTAAVAVAAPGLAAPAGGAVAAYQPAPGPIFNDPYGTNYPQRAIEDHIEAMVNGSPAGSTIRVATLGIDSVTAGRALIAAYRRGVIVRVVLPNALVNTPEVDRLQKVLGTRWWRGGSYVATCKASCYSPGSPYATMHAKIYMFSETGTATHVVTLSSANLTRWAMYHNWNDAYTFVGNDAAYTATRRYFDPMRFDQPRAVPPVTDVGDDDRIYYYPDPTYTRPTDIFTTLLTGTACVGATSASSVKGASVVKVATSRWGGSRLDIARRLGRLVHRGCKVQVLVQADHTAPEVLATLRAWHVPTRYSDGPDGTLANNHSKFFAVSGFVDGDPSRSTVVTGSLNLTGAEVTSDNVVVRIGDSEDTYQRYAESFQPIYRQSTPVTARVIARRAAQVAARR